MKATWIIFFVLGLLLVLLNVPVYFASTKMPDFPDTVGRIAYLIGRNLALIVGVLFLLIAFLVHRKWKRTKEKAARAKLIDSFHS